MSPTSEELSLVVEAFVRSWLTQTDAGRRMLARLDMDIEPAIDSIFELLNAGFVKLERDGTAIAGLELCLPPIPPSGKVQRVRRT